MNEKGSSDPPGPNVIFAPVLLAKENLPGRPELFAICKSRGEERKVNERGVPTKPLAGSEPAEVLILH